MDKDEIKTHQCDHDRHDGLTNRMKIVEERSGSNTMCTAKWTQSTIYLMDGYTHSCHHPAPHKISLESLKSNPSALHNTEQKLKARSQMLVGKRPPECEYCWNIEDLPGNHISDRTYKSANNEWSFPYLSDVLDSDLGENFNPTYMEVAFDNTCSMKCMYCSPSVSSKWMEEVKQYGAYSNTTHNIGNLEYLHQIDRMPIPQKENNPYVNAFWEWWPELYKSLHTFRITGGEPLLSKNTWRVFDEIKNNPRKDLNLAVNTNLQIPNDLFDKFIGFYNSIYPHINDFEVYTSCEATGEHANYIRHGMEYVSFIENCRKFLDKTSWTVTNRLCFMITFNALSIFTFKDFLEDIRKLRSEYNGPDGFNRIPIMINYLRWPTFQDARILPVEIKQKYMDDIIEYVEKNMDASDIGRFQLEDVHQLHRLKEYIMTGMAEPDLSREMGDFGAFFQEYDRRKNLDFEALFPELHDFYAECKDIANNRPRVKPR